MKVKYIDHRPIIIPYLRYHRGGVNLPSGDNIIKVSNSEGNYFLKMKNGSQNCFIEIKEEKIKIDNEVIDDVDR